MISIIKFNITESFYYLIKERDYYLNLNKEQINIIKTLLKIILKYILKTPNLNNKINNIIKLYDLIELENYKKIKFEEICYIIFILSENKEYNFIYDKDLYKYLLNKQNFGVYEFKEIFFYNNDHKNIIINQKKFNDTLLTKIKKNLIY